MVKVTRRRDTTLGLHTAVAEAKARVKHEISKRKEDIEALKKDMQKLTTRMTEEEDTEDLLPEYHRLAKMIKRHKDAIGELEEAALQVEVEVEREHCSVSLVFEEEEKQVRRERRVIVEEGEGRRLYLVGGSKVLAYRPIAQGR